MVDYKELKLGDSFNYECRRCSDCCRDIGGILMVEPSDGYKICKHLNSVGQEINLMELYSEYCEYVALDDSGLGVFVMDSTNGKCVFLEGCRCKIYDARPRICRIYPLACECGKKAGSLDIKLSIDNHVKHFDTDKVVSVREYLSARLDDDSKHVLLDMKNVVSNVYSQIVNCKEDRLRESMIMCSIHFLYMRYDLRRSFKHQYDSNVRKLIRILGKMRKGEIKDGEWLFM